MWRSLLMSVSEREIEFPGISEFVHVPRGTNLDAGTWDEDNGWLRYGSRHNDIFPRLSDAIRFQLGFEPRYTVSNAVAAEKAVIVAEEAEAKAVKEEADVEAEETTA
jgi:hypothetical protein